MKQNLSSVNMPIRNKNILIVISFMLLCLNLYSQTIFKGVVIDNGRDFLGNGADAVENAFVALTDQSDTNRTFSAYTDEQGGFLIEIMSTGLDDDISEIASDFNLYQNYPNPFNPSTVIGYSISKPSKVSLKIYNILGQKVKTLIEGNHLNGSGSIIWDATDDFGHSVSAGVYIYSLQSKGHSINKKMLLIDGQQQGTIINHSITDEIDNRELNKQTPILYTLQIIGENIETFNQRDLDISTIRYHVSKVMRTVKDIDGNVYKTVKIGDQWWMAENLKVTHYQNGDSIPNILDGSNWGTLSTGAFCNYDDDISNTLIYGSLYNWYAIGDQRKISPAGWHVPTDEEWKQMEMALGMNQSTVENDGWRGTNEGSKMAGEEWIWPDGSLDSNFSFGNSGFKALPGGYRTSQSGYYSNMGYIGYFWTSSESINNKAWYRSLYYYNSDIFRNKYIKRHGFSVRCVKDY